MTNYRPILCPKKDRSQTEIIYPLIAWSLGNVFAKLEKNGQRLLKFQLKMTRILFGGLSSTLASTLSVYRVGQKSKLLILSQYVDKTEKIGGMWTRKNSYRENEVLSDIFTSQLFYVLWLKAINEITHRQTRTSLCKHEVIKMCSIEYLTTQVKLMLPTFFQLLDRSQNCRIFNVRAII